MKLSNYILICLMYILCTSCSYNDVSICNSFNVQDFDNNNKYKLTINYTSKDVDESDSSFVIKAYIDQHNCTHFNVKINEKKRARYLKTYILENINNSNGNLIFQITVSEELDEKDAYSELKRFINDYKSAYKLVYEEKSKELFNKPFKGLNSDEREIIENSYPFNPAAEHYITYMKNRDEINRILSPK